MLVVMSMIFRVVLVLFLVRMGLRFAVGLLAPRRAPQKGTIDELVRDRICNAYVPRGRAVHLVVAGHEELFCSSVCAQRALSESAGRA
jgi:hypothetical protein